MSNPIKQTKGLPFQWKCPDRERGGKCCMRYSAPVIATHYCGETQEVMLVNGYCNRFSNSSASLRPDLCCYVISEGVTRCIKAYT